MCWCCITSVANTCITCVGNVLHVLVLHYKCVTADHEPVSYKGSHVWHGPDSCIAKSCISNMRLQLVRSNQARTNCLTKHGLNDFNHCVTVNACGALVRRLSGRNARMQSPLHTPVVVDVQLTARLRVRIIPCSLCSTCRQLVFL